MIEYNAPVSGGTSLAFPLKQVTVNISNSELKSLHTSPYQILPSGISICVINAILDYKNTNLNTGQEMWIGYENLLNGNLISNQIRFGTTFMAGSTGIMSVGANDTMLYYASTENYQSLVLWQQIDDSVSNFDYFILTVTYIEYS
jgi:hypothetical protein